MSQYKGGHIYDMNETLERFKRRIPIFQSEPEGWDLALTSEENKGCRNCWPGLRLSPLCVSPSEALHFWITLCEVFCLTQSWFGKTVRSLITNVLKYRLTRGKFVKLPFFSFISFFLFFFPLHIINRTMGHHY